MRTITEADIINLCKQMNKDRVRPGGIFINSSVFDEDIDKCMTKMIAEENERPWISVMDSLPKIGAKVKVKNNVREGFLNIYQNIDLDILKYHYDFWKQI